jgi:pyrroloquinoline-quinone synthase
MEWNLSSERKLRPSMEAEQSQPAPWDRGEFERQLRALRVRYHSFHPYHVMLNEGRLTPAQLRGWVANRFYYQVNLPVKDAAIAANCPEAVIRRRLVQRMVNQDGAAEGTGGVEAWLKLGAACGLSREEMTSMVHVLPGVRFAVDAYVNFARRAPWQEAICASLSELFASDLHQQRIANWPRLYPWIRSEALEYFRERLQQGPSDVSHALEVALDYFTTRQAQERALGILAFKLDVLWAMADAMYLAYVVNMPPYAVVQTKEGQSAN